VKALRWICLVAGVALFAYSFTLPAIREAAKPGGAGGNTVAGYWCAFLALAKPWGKEGITLLHSDPLTYFSVLWSGLTNPVFVLALPFLVFKPRSLINRVFLVLLALMLICSWLVLQRIQRYGFHFYAFTGFYVWMCGILLALFSDLWVQKPAAAGTAKP
jgi:hypothetical protein